MTVREDLAAAAGSVEGVSAFPYYKQGSQAGHCFIRLEKIDFPNKFGGVVRWNVIVVLPSDLAKAEQYLEEKVPLIKTALEPHMTVLEAVPQYLSINGVGDLLCVFINGQREE